MIENEFLIDYHGLGDWTIFYLTIPNLKGNEAVIQSAEPPVASMIG